MSGASRELGGEPSGEKGRERVLTCPVCGKPMEEGKVGNTSIDVCDAHGVWLDRGELEAIERSQQARGVARSRIAGKEALQKAKASGKLSGWIFGPLSFLWD